MGSLVGEPHAIAHADSYAITLAIHTHERTPNMIPAYGIGYGQVLYQGHWVADVLYDILHKYPTPARTPVVHIDLYLRHGHLQRLVHQADVTLWLMDGAVYPIMLTTVEHETYFPAYIISENENAPGFTVCTSATTTAKR